MREADITWTMHNALEEAEKAARAGEVPVGAVLLDEFGNELARAHNEKEKNFDVCGHAEVLAIRKASKNLKNWRLTGCKLFVTLEPCAMCLSAMQQARISELYFGAYDTKGGALSLGYRLFSDSRLNHQFAVRGGICHFECSRMLSQFFKERREGYGKLADS